MFELMLGERMEIREEFDLHIDRDSMIGSNSSHLLGLPPISQSPDILGSNRSGPFRKTHHVPELSPRARYEDSLRPPKSKVGSH